MIDDTACEKHQLLIGHPPASDFFHFVRTVAADGERFDADELTQIWRKANARVRELREVESGLAERIDCRELPEEMREPAASALADAVSRGYRTAPRRWQLLELDRLTVVQKRINLTWTAQLALTLGRSPSDRQLIEFAAGASVTRPSVRVARADDGTYTLACSSGELRFLGTQFIDPSQPVTPRIPGGSTHVIGLFIGMGFNVMSALRYRNRLILTNGTHRAFTLRQHGLTHAPCLVIDAEHDDDLDLAGVREVRGQIERFARLPRPPLLKDYFDPELRWTVPVPRSQHALQIQVTSRSLRVPLPD